MEELRQQLQTCIGKVLQRTSFKLHLAHNANVPWDQLEDNEEPIIVWNEPILDCYWDLLEAEIDRREWLVADICGISIENVEMKKERLATLVAILRNGKANNSTEYISTLTMQTFVAKALYGCQNWSM